MAQTIGYLLAAISLMVAFVNFYLSFADPLVRRLFSKEPRHVSGIPVVGTVFLIFSLLCLGKLDFLVITTIGTQLALDTGGIFWLALTLCIHGSNGKEPKKTAEH